MNKYLRGFGILAILCFSFYCAEQTALFMQKKDPIYETIVAVKEDYKVNPVDAIVSDQYITPGMVGLEINIVESFKNMKNVGAFQANKLVFEEIKPAETITSNKSLIIKQGNPLKLGVSFLVMDEQLIAYFEEMGMPYNILTTNNTVDKMRAYGLKINYDFSNYDMVEKKLLKNKENSDFCFITSNHKDFCMSKNKILIEESKSINKTNFAKILPQIESGDIIYLQNNLGILNLKLLLEQVRFKGLRVLSLNELLSESR